MLQHGFCLGPKLDGVQHCRVGTNMCRKKEAWFYFLLNLQEAPTTNQLFQEPPLLDYEQLNPAQLIESGKVDKKLIKS